MKDWWKYLTIGILLYVIIFSFYRPLSPGIASVNRDILKKGMNENIDVQAYNISFPTEKNAISIWVKCGENEFCVSDYRTKADVLSFDLFIPDTLPSHALSLYIQFEQAFFSLENAFHVNDIVVGKSISSNDCIANNKTLDSKDSNFPNRTILNETIRNLMFHVPMWFVMMILMLISVIYSIKHLAGFKLKYDTVALQAVNVGLLFAVCGLLTGSLWARFTWGQWWISDTKLNGAAITTLIYFAYIILRGSIQEEQQRARIAAVYNIFAFVILIVMLMILPRMTDSLHPGNGGNPAFSQYDLDSSLRMVFYPAVLGWIGLSMWILQIKIRSARIIEKIK